MNLDFTWHWFKNSAKLPLVLQNERAECGHACVAMISNYWGHQIDLHGLRRLSNTSSRGVTLSQLTQLFERLGFMTRPLQVPIEELHLVKCPAILHWNMNHFVVLRKVKKGHLVIHDPALGIVTCSLQEAQSAFTGIVLEVEKSAEFETLTSAHPLKLFDLVRMFQGLNQSIILLLLLSLAIELLSLMNPLFMQYVTDNVIGYSEKSNLFVLASAFLGVMLIQVFTEYLRGNMVVFYTNQMAAQFSSNVVSHILKLPLEFFEKRHIGDLQSKVQSIDLIQKKISTDFVNTVLDGMMILINFSVMLIYSRILSLLVLVALLLCFGVRYLSYQHLQSLTGRSVRQHAKALTIFIETIQGILPIKSFLKERVRLNLWRNNYIDSLNADIKVSKMNVAYQVVNQLLFHVEQLAVVSIGAVLVLSNTFSVGMLIAFLSYRLLLVNKATSFIQSIFEYRLISIQLNRLGDILFQQPEVVNIGRGAEHEGPGALMLKNVSFKYEVNGPEVFSQLSLDIHPGEKVVVVGSSGCGKTTLLKVMMGLLPSTEGEIYVNDIPLAQFGLKNYREYTASVMQDDVLLMGSIIDNIVFFDEEIDLKRVIEVAQLAFIHETIMTLPMGYETLLGDTGINFSGGQKQRLLLARALYKKPKILFLDEASSHLDIENEKNINRSLRSLAITQIVIAHRQETIQMADRVIDLQQENSINKY